jgi:amidase
MLLHNDPAHAFMPYPAVPVPDAGRGPLAGLTFAAKDLFDVAGYPTSGGNPLLLALSGVKTQTAPTVQKLLDAGARFVGKVITDELAFSMNGKNAHFGAPRNGAAPDRIAGGSSCGSASAVSNALCDFALGTDTCGFFARDVQTFARVADVLIGADDAPLSAPRLLRADDVWGLLGDEPRKTLAPVLGRLEATFGPAAPAQAALDSFDTMYWAFRYIQGREAWRTDGSFIERHAPPLGPGVAERFAWSSRVTDAQVADATTFRNRFRAHLAALLGSDGVLVLPTMPDIAPLTAASESELEDYRNVAIKMLCIAGLAGFPQVSLPLTTRLGAPLGISLLGPAGSDRSLIAMAETLGA